MSIYSLLFRKSVAFVIAVFLLGLSASTAFGAELYVPVVTGTKGEIIALPVTVDKVANLAGIKLSLSYDKNTLKFIKAEKTTYTANMLYVVNDKVPGKLIVVMAAARGFTGGNAPLVEISFELLQDVKKKDNVTLQIVESELMDDGLKRIKVNSH